MQSGIAATAVYVNCWEFFQGGDTVVGKQARGGKKNLKVIPALLEGISTEIQDAWTFWGHNAPVARRLNMYCCQCAISSKSLTLILGKSQENVTCRPISQNP